MGSAPAVLRWEVITTGRLLVERDEIAVDDFVRRARWEAEDDEQRNRMILLAQTADLEGRLRDSRHGDLRAIHAAFSVIPEIQ